MVLYTTPYSGACLHFLDGLSWSLVFPCYWLLDRLLASCVATSLEKRQRSQDPCSFLTLCVLVSAPLYLLLLLASLPFALLGFILWAPLQAVRQPYLYTYSRSDLHDVGLALGGGVGEWRPQGRSFCFCSANVCLLPDSLARFNNLSDTHRRAREVGKRIRNGASRPQIKIYIDSPTNTSISAASFCSLGPPQCPLHRDDSDTTADCPLHANGGSDCPVHTSGEAPHCPLHCTGAQTGPDHHDCPMHGEGAQPKPPLDCPLHTSGVQISISAPEPDPQGGESETGNHRPGDQAGGDTGSMTASRESLARYHGGDGGVGISSNNTLSHVPRTSIFKRPGRKRRHGDETFDHEISAFFPANLDFLALQEVFDHGSTTRLRHQLHRYFPYVLSDVGQYGWKSCCSSFKFLNSGLMLASRYPILDARFECYPNGRGEDALAAKGALFAKVHVGTSHQEQRVVGYITCTHLHAIEGDAAVRCEQLDLLLQWGAEFRQASSRQPEGEKVFEDLVAFDVVLGDLNFDNCSSEDKLEQQHALFTQYKDPCRLGPGEDKPWALGNYTTTQLHNDTMTLVMENEEASVPAAARKDGRSPLKGNGRRIDYILYSDEGLNQDWKLDIEEFSFVTQLAGLTDHLSVAMRLSVATGDDEP
uniref:Sphingomyelin phosphodiesterase 3 n=1 Tax=Sphaeramia orbicularis TaxID=375764 RepID=A0A672Z201_9TELE